MAAHVYVVGLRSSEAFAVAMLEHLMKEMPFIMATHIVNDIQVELVSEAVSDEAERIGCSIGIMAYNEEANIASTLQAVLAQTGPSIIINEVIVVASGCTDRTVPIVS